MDNLMQRVRSMSGGKIAELDQLLQAVQSFIKVDEIHSFIKRVIAGESQGNKGIYLEYGKRISYLESAMTFGYNIRDALSRGVDRKHWSKF